MDSSVGFKIVFLDLPDIALPDQTPEIYTDLSLQEMPFSSISYCLILADNRVACTSLTLNMLVTSIQPAGFSIE